MLSMKYILEPSLEYITHLKVVTTLYNQDDVKKSFPEVYSSSISTYKAQWLNTEAIVERKVAELPLPKVLKDKMICFIRPVRLQIAEWKAHMYRRLTKNTEIHSEFYWTPLGILDEKKMAEGIIRDKHIDITERYRLACIFCLEDDILKLWQKVPEDRKNTFYSQDGPSHVQQPYLVLLWTYYIKGEMEKMDSMVEQNRGRRYSAYQYAFRRATKDCNRVATEFFFKKLTTAEREECLGYNTILSLELRYWRFRLHGFRKSSHILHFLLSRLNEENQIEVLTRAPYFVLLCFLDWPLQMFFMETVHQVWNFLDEFSYGRLLIEILDNIIDNNKDFNYRELFFEFWKQSPDNLKQYALSGRYIHRLLIVLFKLKDINDIKLIFQNVTSERKKLFIYDDEACIICKTLMIDNQLTLLKYFIKECLPSLEEVMEFNERFKKGEVWHVNKYSMRDWHRKLICILTVVTYEFKKRKCEESDAPNAKKCKICISDSVHSAE